MLSYEAKQLDDTLQKFVAEIRKKDGSEYEPDSLRVTLASLDRHLREKDAAFSIAKDIEFSNSRKVLEGKAKLLRQEGFGKRANAAKALTSQDEELLWSKGVLGSHSPQSLIQTMWFLLTQQFGLRGCQEHHDMYVEDFAFSTDDNGIEFVTCASVNSTCAQPPPGNCGAFARLVSPGGGAFATVALPGGRAFANPRANPELLTRTWFPIRIYKVLLEEKQIGSFVKDRNKL